MKENTKRKSGVVGVTGEYFVAAELSQRGIVAVLTLKNTPSIDILATNLEKGKFANIQVKTMSIGNNAGWRMSEKDEKVSSIKNHYYVFVNLKGLDQHPEYIVIPQDKLSAFLRKDYLEYISGNKKDGTKRKEISMRIFDPNRRKGPKEFAEKYKSNWNILGLW